MKHGKGVVDDERPTKENKREVRGVELTFSRVDVHRCCPLATYTTHERRRRGNVEGDGEWWTTRGERCGGWTRGSRAVVPVNTAEEKKYEKT